jgi:CMP-2-keto-3-deoxyoctulosonic acid synthetase
VQGDEPLVTGEQIRALAAGLAGEAAIATLAVPFDNNQLIKHKYLWFII